MSRNQRIAALLAGAMLLLTACGCTEQRTEDPIIDPGVIVQPSGRALDMVHDMKIGWNLGDTLDVCAADRNDDGRIDEHPADGVEVDETLWGNVLTTEALFAALHDDGVNAVRIPVTWRDHIGDAPEYTISPEWLARVHTVVDYALDQGMYVIINVHHDGGGDPMFGAWIRQAARDYPGTAEKYVTLWKQIAESFADYPDTLIFESMNEVGFDNMAQPKAYQTLNDLNQLFVKTVRKSGGNNDARNLLIAGYWTDVEQTCNALWQLPEDTADGALIVSVHYYTPWEFCTTDLRESWGSPHDVRLMESHVDMLRETFTDRGIPVIVGEYGTGTGNDTASRLYFAELFTKLCHEQGIPCFYWDNGGEFDRVNMVWRTDGLIDALNRAVSDADYEVTKAAG